MQLGFKVIHLIHSLVGLHKKRKETLIKETLIFHYCSPALITIGVEQLDSCGIERLW